MSEEGRETSGSGWRVDSEAAMMLPERHDVRAFADAGWKFGWEELSLSLFQTRIEETISPPKQFGT